MEQERLSLWAYCQFNMNLLLVILSILMTLLMILQAEKLEKFNYINNCLILPL